MTPRVAVLGANGQVGVALSKHLVSAVRCVAVVRNGVAAAAVRALAGPDVDIRVGSVSDPGQARALIGDCASVINCAFASGGGVLASRRANLSLFDGVRLAAPDASFVHLSSVAVYGPGGADPERPRPDSSYGREKLRHERYLQAHVPADRLLIVRLGHVYGADTPISRFILDCHHDSAFRLNVSDAASNAVAIGRVAASLAAACVPDGPRGLYHLVNQPNTTWRRLFDVHAEAFGLTPVMDGGAAPPPPDEAGVIRGLLATLRSTIRPPDPRALAGNLVIRTALDAALGAAPASAERTLRRWYRRRVVRAQLAGSEKSSGVIVTPNWMYFPPVSGRHLPSPEAWDAEVTALRAWSHRILDPRWSFEAPAVDMAALARPARSFDP